MTDYVGAWDCPYCGQKKIWGFIYDCPGCGHPRSKDIEFYLPTENRVATPEEMKLMGHDPNWYCEHCGAGNQDIRIYCQDCGAERGSSPTAKVRDYEFGKTPTTGEDAQEVLSADTEEPDLLHANRIQDMPRDTSQIWGSDQDWKDRNSWMRYAGIGIGALAILIFIWQFFFATHTTPAFVNGFSWNRNVEIQEYRTLHEQGWTIPLGGRMTSSYRKQNGTVRISDGYTTESYSDTCYRTESRMGTCSRSVYHSRTCERSNGNGSFSSYSCGYTSSESYSCSKMESVPYSCTKTRQKELYHYEPTYGTWFLYDIERWVNDGNFPTSGKDHSPYYDPKPQATDDKHKRIEDPGTYTTYFTCSETGNFQKDYSFSEWSNMNVGDEWSVTTNFMHVMLNVEKK